jgi:hypothetical protein
MCREPNGLFRVFGDDFGLTQQERDFEFTQEKCEMSQKDLWERAAECVQAIEATSDPARREMLTHLQTLWTNLANESPFLRPDNLDEQIGAIGRIHSDLIQTATNQAT